MIGVVGVDRLLQQIGHGVYSSLMTSTGTTSAQRSMRGAWLKHSATNFIYGSSGAGPIPPQTALLQLAWPPVLGRVIFLPIRLRSASNFTDKPVPALFTPCAAAVPAGINACLCGSLNWI
jgi:hypothetical protein